MYFIPWVFLLKWGSIKVINWDKSKGKIIRKLHPQSPHWFPIEKVSQMTISSIIVAEDVFFYSHIGIDTNSIFESIKTNYKAQQIKRGASTITQQVIRLAFLSQRKSYLRKIREILGALLLEKILTKDEILAWYLNLVYFGNGITGIKDASWKYFETSPTNLNLNNSIQLALTLPSPNQYGKHILNKHLNESSHKKFYFILNELRNQKLITHLQWKNSLSTGNFGNPILNKRNKKNFTE